MTEQGQPHTAIMYALDGCPYCDKARALLRNKGIGCVQIPLATHQGEFRNLLTRVTGSAPRESQHFTVPQIFIREGRAGIRYVGGCSDLQKYLGR